MANSDMRDESISKRQGWLSLTILLVSLKFPHYSYLQQNLYISSSCFSRCQYVPETLMQKNNIIGNDMRIK